MFEKFEDVVLVSDLMQMLHIGRNTAYELVSSGQIKSVRVGNRYLIPKQNVTNFVLGDGVLPAIPPDDILRTTLDGSVVHEQEE